VYTGKVTYACKVTMQSAGRAGKLLEPDFGEGGVLAMFKGRELLAPRPVLVCQMSPDGCQSAPNSDRVAARDAIAVL
jgi:hypothetical protein